MAVRIAPVVTKDVLLRLSSSGIANSESSWRRLRREQIVTNGVRSQVISEPGGRSSRSQRYVALNGLSILLADHAHLDERARDLRDQTELLEKALGRAVQSDPRVLERLSTKLERLWKRFLPTNVREVRGVVRSVDSDRALVEDKDTQYSLFLPTGHGLHEGDAVIVLQIAGQEGRWTTCILPGIADDDVDGQAQYDAQFDPGPAVVDEIAALIEDAKRNGASPRPVTLTLM